MIQAIETRYKGHRFRSRLEARWAVFFDALGLSWVYEFEGYDLESGERYLPDFVVTYPGRWEGEEHEVFFEVKGCIPTQREINLAYYLSKGTGKPVVFAVGVPDFKEYKEITADEFSREYQDLADCALWSSKGRRWIYPSDLELDAYTKNCPEYVMAVNAARSARFEFGEEG